MSTTIDRRLSKLEDRSPWGGKAELAAARSWVMCIPAGAESDKRVTEARERALSSGKHLSVTTVAAAGGPPLWRPVPIEKIPDELLDTIIDELRARIAASEAA